MKYINEAFTTPIADEYDIIVVGAGPAGCGTALSAARSGAKTLIIDKFNSLGGMWTQGFMNPLFDAENKDGIMAEIISDLKAKNQWGGFWEISFHYEYMKQLLDTKMSEAGVDILLCTKFSKAVIENKTVKGVVVENANGRSAYLSKYVVDCTGDGNVAADAGCDYEIGVDNKIEDCQGMTLMFLIGNIPEKYKNGLMIGEIVDACYTKVGKEAPFHKPYLIPVPNSHFGVVQFTHMYNYNPLVQKDIDAATTEGRRQMLEVFELLKTYYEDFKDIELICSAPVLGIRESRRIVGEYTLTVEDVTEGNGIFPDGICRVKFGIDIHPKNGKAQDCRSIQPYDIPFRACIPKGYNGLIIAGRCISGTHEAMASYRVTGDCCKMGDSIGQLLAYSIANNIPARNIDVSAVLK